MSIYEFITRNFRGAFIVVLTRGGWFDFGEVVDGSAAGLIGLLNIFGTDYVVTEAIDIFF